MPDKVRRLVEVWPDALINIETHGVKKITVGEPSLPVAAVVYLHPMWTSFKTDYRSCSTITVQQTLVLNNELFNLIGMKINLR